MIRVTQNKAGDRSRTPNHRVTFDADFRQPVRMRPLMEMEWPPDVPLWAREAMRRSYETVEGPPHAVLGHVRESKVVQWVLGYLALALVILEATNVLSAIWGWPVGLERGVSLWLGLNVFPVSVIAWYHGEKGRQRVTAPELLIVVGMVLAIIAAVWRVSA